MTGNAFTSSALTNFSTSAVEGLAGVLLGILYRDVIQRRRVARNEIKDLSSVTVTETAYIRERLGGPRKPGTSLSEDELDRLYYTQIIRNFDAVDLSKAYAASHYRSIAKHIESGIDACTNENPLPFSHVFAAISKKEKDPAKRLSYKKAFTDPILNHFSNAFNPNTTSYVLQNGSSRKRSYENEIWLIPLVFFEPNAAKKQLRLMFTTEADLLAVANMDPTRVHCEGDSEGLGQNHIHFDRFRTLQIIAKLYADPNSNVREVLRACAFGTQAYEAPRRLHEAKRKLLTLPRGFAASHLGLAELAA